MVLTSASRGIDSLTPDGEETLGSEWAGTVQVSTLAPAPAAWFVGAAAACWGSGNMKGVIAIVAVVGIDSYFQVEMRDDRWEKWSIFSSFGKR